MSKLMYFSRDEVTLTAYDVKKIAPYISADVARRRLKRWEKGKLDCEDLFKLQQDSNNYRDQSLLALECKKLGPRRDPEDIKITSFERELVRQLDQRRQGYGLDESEEA